MAEVPGEANFWAESTGNQMEEMCAMSEFRPYMTIREVKKCFKWIMDNEEMEQGIHWWKPLGFNRFRYLEGELIKDEMAFERQQDEQSGAQ